MRFPTVILLSILFCRSLMQGAFVEERKTNMVVKILNTILRDFGKLIVNNITIPLVDLGEWGRFENLTVSLPKVTNRTDGLGSFGFELHVNVSEIIATGYYNVINVDVPGLFPISGEGDFAAFADAVNLRLKIKAKNLGEKFDFSIEIFTVQIVNTKLHFENLMGDPHVSDFLNELLGNLMPNLVETFLQYEPLLKIFQTHLDHYGNGVVNCILTQITDLENCIKKLF